MEPNHDDPAAALLPLWHSCLAGYVDLHFKAIIVKLTPNDYFSLCNLQGLAVHI